MKLIATLFISTLIYSPFLGAAELSLRGPSYEEDSAFVEVTALSHYGSGCPSGTVYESISEHGSYVTLTDFMAEIGSGVPTGDSRRNCQLVIETQVPQGYRVAMLPVQFHGFADLEDDVTLTLSQTFHEQGGENSKTISNAINGPYWDDFSVKGSLEDQDLVWSSCYSQSTLVLNLSARLRSSKGRDGYGFMILDSYYGDRALDLRFKLSRCPQLLSSL